MSNEPQDKLDTAINAYFEPARKRQLEELWRDLSLWFDFERSGLSIREFARIRGIDKGIIAYIKRKHNLKPPKRDHAQALKVAKLNAMRKYERVFAPYLKCDCDCISNKLLHEILAEHSF
jgi:hypothetical protein